MVLRRTGERRRRVVMDEALQASSEVSAETRATADSSKGRRQRQYSRNADRKNLARCADFVPVNRAAMLGGWCVCLAVLLLLNLGYGLVGANPSKTFPVTSEVLGFGSRSLSTWSQIIAWAGAGLCSLVVFGVRQHRSNDFRGTYRLWRWMALACGVMSLASLANVPGMFAEWLSWSAGKLFSRDGTLLVSIQAFVALAVTVRLIFELRSSRAATALVVAAGGCGIAALLFQHELIGSSLQSNRELVAGNLWIWTAALVLMCFLTYARFVILHASGAIHVPEKSVGRKKKKRATAGKSKSKSTRKRGSRSASSSESEQESEEETDWSAEEDEDSGEQADEEEESQAESRTKSNSSRSAPPLAAKMRGNQKSSAADDDDEQEEADESESMSGLSRADRKRLKRDQRQGRRAA